MGVRIGKTPRPGARRGCWRTSATVLLGALTLVGLGAAKCTSGDAPPNPHKPSNEQLYRQCVGQDRSKAKQDQCQVHVWGSTFGEEDSRWICYMMGNWICEEPKGKL